MVDLTEKYKEQTEQANAKSKAFKKAKEYKVFLASTDWYYARRIETGEEVPEDVAIKRTEAREYIRSQEDV